MIGEGKHRDDEQHQRGDAVVGYEPENIIPVEDALVYQSQDDRRRQDEKGQGE
jgi:hypothetical protein